MSAVEQSPVRERSLKRLRVTGVLSVNGSGDLISQWQRGLLNVISDVPESTISFWIKLGLLLGVSTAFCTLSFLQGCRSRGIQIGWCVLGWFVVGLIPTAPLVPGNAVARLWIIVACAIAIWLCPRVLAR